MKKWLLLIVWTSFVGMCVNLYNEVTRSYEKEIVFIYTEEVDDWNLLIEAIIRVESNGNDSIVNHKNAGGCLQLTPIYIAEANHIIGKKGYYSVDDRFDRHKSIEIFKVVNGFHNPEKDFSRAIKLHNPLAGEWYMNRVYNEYNKIKNGTDI